MTVQGLRLDAALAILESLQRAGYFLHDRDGEALSRETFITAVSIACDDVLAQEDVIRNELADETIESLVSFIESAEIMAQSMAVSVSKAYRFMLKSSQAFARMQRRSSIESLVVPTKQRGM